jgi:hypothetical protein
MKGNKLVTLGSLKPNNIHMYITNKGVKGAESLASLRRGWIAPLYLNTSSPKFLLVTLMTLLPSSIGALMGLWEEHLVSLPSFRGLEPGNESPPFKWEWFSEPLDCPPNERCNPESMVGTMNPLEGNPRPSRAGRKSETIGPYFGELGPFQVPYNQKHGLM